MCKPKSKRREEVKEKFAEDATTKVLAGNLIPATIDEDDIQRAFLKDDIQTADSVNDDTKGTNIMRAPSFRVSKSVQLLF